MNYSLMLKQLQLGYLQITMKDQSNNDQCIYCWKSNCGCNSKTTAQSDNFINFTGEELKYV